MTEANKILLKDRDGKPMLPITNAALVQVDNNGESNTLNNVLTDMYSTYIAYGEKNISGDTIYGAFAAANIELT